MQALDNSLPFPPKTNNVPPPPVSKDEPTRSIPWKQALLPSLRGGITAQELHDCLWVAFPIYVLFPWVLFGLIFYGLGMLYEGGCEETCYYLAILLTVLFFVFILPALLVRRMHSLGRSGWWIIFYFFPPIIGFFLITIIMRNFRIGAGEL